MFGFIGPGPMEMVIILVVVLVILGPATALFLYLRYVIKQSASYKTECEERKDSGCLMPAPDAANDPYRSPELSAEKNSSLNSDQQYRDIPWFRRSDVVSCMVVAGFCIFPPLLWGVCIALVTGDVYYNKHRRDGTLKVWHVSNKIVAWLLLAAHSYMIYIAIAKLKIIHVSILLLPVVAVVVVALWMKLLHGGTNSGRLIPPPERLPPIDAQLVNENLRPCPDCQQVSIRAESCPKCGCPIKDAAQDKANRTEPDHPETQGGTRSF